MADEIEIFKGLLKWGAAHPDVLQEMRPIQDVVRPLLRLIRFPLMSSSEFENLVVKAYEGLLSDREVTNIFRSIARRKLLRKSDDVVEGSLFSCEKRAGTSKTSDAAVAMANENNSRRSNVGSSKTPTMPPKSPGKHRAKTPLSVGPLTHQKEQQRLNPGPGLDIRRPSAPQLYIPNTAESSCLPSRPKTPVSTMDHVGTSAIPTGSNFSGVPIKRPMAQGGSMIPPPSHRPRF